MEINIIPEDDISILIQGSKNCNITFKNEFIQYLVENKIISKKKLVLNDRPEIEFKKILNKTFKNIINFIPQYLCCNKYKIDFYSKEYNLAIEYDEEQHRYQQEKDKIREQDIYNELGCDFIRIKKGQELEGVNMIFKYILNI